MQTSVTLELQGETLSGRRRRRGEKQTKAKPGQVRPLLSQRELSTGKPWGQGLSTEQAQGRGQLGGWRESSLGHLLPGQGH